MFGASVSIVRGPAVRRGPRYRRPSDSSRP